MGYLLPSMHQTFKFNADATEVSIAVFNKVRHNLFGMQLKPSNHTNGNICIPAFSS